MNTKCLILVGLMILFATAAFGQSGGSFAITQSVVAAGGGAAGGGTFEVTGTTGQNVAGTTSSGVPFAVHSGFWSGTLTPSAATVAVSGSVLTSDGRGIRNAVVRMTDQNGTSRIALTSSFGYFQFDDVEAGRNYVITVSSKRFQFAPQVVSVQDELANIEFVALP